MLLQRGDYEIPKPREVIHIEQRINSYHNVNKVWSVNRSFGCISGY